MIKNAINLEFMAINGFLDVIMVGKKKCCFIKNGAWLKPDL